MIYFDHSSATFIEQSVLESYIEVEKNYFANPDALHDFALQSQKLQKIAREKIAELLKVQQNEIIFTSGGSESNTLAIKGYIEKHKHIKNHVLVACGEHSSVKNAIYSIKDIEVEEIPLNKDGNIDIITLKKYIKKNTLFCSMSAVHNEFGSIRDICAIGKYLHEHGVVFHVDAVQMIGKEVFDFTNVDLVSISGHKLHAPKGIGVLIKKQGIQLNPIIYGGQQEFHLRGGTSTVALQVALAKAMRIAISHQQKYKNHIDELHTYLRTQLMQIPEIHINSSEKASKYIVNFSVLNLPSQVVLNALNQAKIYVSATASCVTKSNAVSKVACFENNPKILNGVIRVSFAYTNTIDEVKIFIEKLKEILKTIAKT